MLLFYEAEKYGDKDDAVLIITEIAPNVVDIKYQCYSEGKKIMSDAEHIFDLESLTIKEDIWDTYYNSFAKFIYWHIGRKIWRLPCIYR